MVFLENETDVILKVSEKKNHSIGLAKKVQVFCTILWKNLNKHFGQPNTMVNTCHYTFTKLIECKIPRVNPNVSYGLCVIMVQQSRSIAYKRCTILE